MVHQRILFVTGRLAEFSLKRIVESISQRESFEFEIQVLSVNVAALLNTHLIKQRLTIEGKYDRIIIPGWCHGELDELTEQFGIPFERGPKDLFDLPEHFNSSTKQTPPDLTKYDIEILAEINHAPLMTDQEIITQANHYRDNGADLIDVGCVPGESWNRVGDVIRLLKQEGYRLSIDSFDRKEVEAAVGAGAELVLSCNSSNLEWAAQLGVELVVIPDDPSHLDSLETTMQTLVDQKIPFRLDPILEPIGFGFAESLSRYYEVRKRWSDLPMMMGIGNITELTEVDSAGINMLFAAICQELNIGSVLTTEVINWARSSVAEFDIARRLVRHALEQQVLPKHINHQLVMLRDVRLHTHGEEALLTLSQGIKDPNFRVFVERDEIHIMNRDGYWRGNDPFEIFDQLLKASPEIDASHAFYLGYELCKAITSLTLGKQYTQDQSLQWGMLTIPEKTIHERRS